MLHRALDIDFNTTRMLDETIRRWSSTYSDSQLFFGFKECQMFAYYRPLCGWWYPMFAWNKSTKLLSNCFVPHGRSNLCSQPPLQQRCYNPSKCLSLSNNYYINVKRMVFISVAVTTVWTTSNKFNCCSGYFLLNGRSLSVHISFERFW